MNTRRNRCELTDDKGEGQRGGAEGGRASIRRGGGTVPPSHLNIKGAQSRNERPPEAGVTEEEVSLLTFEMMIIFKGFFQWKEARFSSLLQRFSLASLKDSSASVRASSASFRDLPGFSPARMMSSERMTSLALDSSLTSLPYVHHKFAYDYDLLNILYKTL